MITDTTTTNGSLGIEGYAALFGVPDMSGDIIRPGAFSPDGARLIPAAARRIRMLYQHRADRPIGRWDALREDANGLFVRGQIFTGTRDGADLATLIARGGIDGLSIGFRPRRSRPLRTGGRELLAVDLWEISVVTFPMAPRARLRTSRPRADLRRTPTSQPKKDRP